MSVRYRVRTSATSLLWTSAAASADERRASRWAWRAFTHQVGRRGLGTVHRGRLAKNGSRKRMAMEARGGHMIDEVHPSGGASSRDSNHCSSSNIRQYASQARARSGITTTLPPPQLVFGSAAPPTSSTREAREDLGTSAYVTIEADADRRDSRAPASLILPLPLPAVQVLC